MGTAQIDGSGRVGAWDAGVGRVLVRLVNVQVSVNFMPKISLLSICYGMEFLFCVHVVTKTYGGSYL